MMYSLTGKLIDTDLTSAVVECGGVGYQCLVSLTTLQQLPPVGEQTMLYTVMNVRQDTVELIGFARLEEKECYRLLTGISGVGPRAGLSVLSALTPEKLSLCVASGDYKTITTAQGVGPKIAQRIVMELKDRIGSLPTGDDAEAAQSAVAGGPSADAVGALVALGYSQSEASLAVGRLDASLPVEELIRQALKSLARGL